MTEQYGMQLRIGISPTQFVHLFLIQHNALWFRISRTLTRNDDVTIVAQCIMWPGNYYAVTWKDNSLNMLDIDCIHRNMVGRARYLALWRPRTAMPINISQNVMQRLLKNNNHSFCFHIQQISKWFLTGPYLPWYYNLIIFFIISRESG